MQTGAITSYIDVAQLTLYVFWLFFAGLIFYLRREDKREGYPLESERSAFVRVQGFPNIPTPKTFRLAHGGTYSAPDGKADTREVLASAVAAWPGAPLEPTGNAMVDGVGAAAYAERENAPELTLDGQPSIVPLRVATDFAIAPGDPDPRGMAVLAGDEQSVGTISDVWVDRSEPQIRFFEAELAGGAGRVLIPVTAATIRADRRQIQVPALMARHFADAPVLANGDVVTKREEDRIAGYFAGGKMFADPSWREPLL